MQARVVVIANTLGVPPQNEQMFQDAWEADEAQLEPDSTSGDPFDADEDVEDEEDEEQPVAVRTAMASSSSAAPSASVASEPPESGEIEASDDDDDDDCSFDFLDEDIRPRPARRSEKRRKL